MGSSIPAIREAAKPPKREHDDPEMPLTSVLPLIAVGEALLGYFDSVAPSKLSNQSSRSPGTLFDHHSCSGQ